MKIGSHVLNGMDSTTQGRRKLMRSVVERTKKKVEVGTIKAEEELEIWEKELTLGGW